MRLCVSIPNQRKSRALSSVNGWLRDRCVEATELPRKVARAIGDKVEAAPRRGDLFEKRRQLVVQWAQHCGRKSDCSARSHGVSP